MTAPDTHHIAAAPAAGHAHVADLEACLDLINSVEYTDGVPEDHIPSVEDAIDYFARRSLAHEDALRGQAAARPAAWLACVQAARGALREVWDAAVEGRTVEAGAVEALNGVLVHSPHPVLRATLAGVTVDHHHEEDALAEALARVAEPLVHAIAAGDTARFRICANDDCRWVFEDTSRGGRRRWCDMSSCGNRAKVRRFRSKRRDADEPAPEAG
jgi:predicted RNA-binding Zn ribbon-like protein